MAVSLYEGINDTISGISIFERASVATSMGLTNGTLYGLSGSLGSEVSWIFAGIVLTAKVGLDYRRLKKGEITSEQFTYMTQKNGVGLAGSIIGGAGGMAAGFAVGSLVFPGVGSVIGALIGGYSGSWAGGVNAQ